MQQHKNTAFMQPEVNAENLTLVLFTKAQTIIICMHKTLCSCIEVLQLIHPYKIFQERSLACICMSE